MNKEKITFKEKNGEDLLYFEQLIQNYSKSQLAEANIDLQQENKHLKEHIKKYEHYCKTTGIKELMENKKYKEVIDKAIKCIEDTYYSKNTTDIDSIVLSNNELLKIRKILKEVE